MPRSICGTNDAPIRKLSTPDSHNDKPERVYENLRVFRRLKRAPREKKQMGDYQERVKGVKPGRREQERQREKDFIVFLHHDLESDLRGDDDEIHAPKSFPQEREQRVIAEEGDGDAAARVPQHEAERRRLSREDDGVAEPVEPCYFMPSRKSAEADLLVVMQVAKLMPQYA